MLDKSELGHVEEHHPGAALPTERYRLSKRQKGSLGQENGESVVSHTWDKELTNVERVWRWEGRDLLLQIKAHKPRFKKNY